MKTLIRFLIVLCWVFIGVAHAAQSSSKDISARVFNSADIRVQQLNPGEWQSLTFDSERWDTANLHDNKTQAGRLKAPVAGTYYMFANITWESPIESGVFRMRLRLNGKTVIAEQSVPNTAAPYRTSMAVGTLYALAAGDYVEVQVYQQSGSPLSILHLPAASPEFGMGKMQ